MERGDHRVELALVAFIAWPGRVFTGTLSSANSPFVSSTTDGDYLLAVKEDQLPLYGDSRLLFDPPATSEVLPLLARCGAHY